MFNNIIFVYVLPSLVSAKMERFTLGNSPAWRVQRTDWVLFHHPDLNINWDGLPDDTKGIYGLFRGWLAKGLEGRTCS